MPKSRSCTEALRRLKALQNNPSGNATQATARRNERTGPGGRPAGSTTRKPMTFIPEVRPVDDQAIVSISTTTTAPASRISSKAGWGQAKVRAFRRNLKLATPR